MDKLPEHQQYCPFCQRVITASNIDEIESGEHDGYIFVHDEIEHDDDWNFSGFDA